MILVVGLFCCFSISHKEAFNWTNWVHSFFPNTDIERSLAGKNIGDTTNIPSVQGKNEINAFCPFKSFQLKSQ